MAVSEAQFRSDLLPFTLHEEGGLSTDRADPGNWTGGKVGEGEFKGTKYGIAASSHPGLDIRNLTVGEAGNIYWSEYMPSEFRVLNPALAMVIFDCGVNCGVGEAEKVLAEARRAIGTDAQVRAASAANLAYHKRLRTWSRYGKVWGGRIDRCQTQALRILGGAPIAHSTPTETSPTPTAPKPHTQPAMGFWARFFYYLFHRE